MICNTDSSPWRNMWFCCWVTAFPWFTWRNEYQFGVGCCIPFGVRIWWHRLWWASILFFFWWIIGYCPLSIWIGLAHGLSISTTIIIVIVVLRICWWPSMCCWLTIAELMIVLCYSVRVAEMSTCHSGFSYSMDHAHYYSYCGSIFCCYYSYCCSIYCGSIYLCSSYYCVRPVMIMMMMAHWSWMYVCKYGYCFPAVYCHHVHPYLHLHLYSYGCWFYTSIYLTKFA